MNKVYGHRFYQASIDKRVAFFNNQLSLREYGTLEEIADDHFLDVEDIKEEFRGHGYYYVDDMNQFVRCRFKDVI